MPYVRKRRPHHRSTEPSPQRKEPLVTGTFDYSARGARLVITFLLGLWLGAIVLVAVGIPRSFGAVDSVMTSPPTPVETVFKKIGPVAARALLRYQVAESNRKLIEIWGWIQLLLAAGVFGLVLFGTRSRKLAIALAGLMLFLAVLMNFLLVPRFDGLSRVGDFSEAASPTTEGTQCMLLHRGFVAFEITLAILGAALFVTLAHRRISSGSSSAASPDSGDLINLAGE